MPGVDAVWCVCVLLPMPLSLSSQPTLLPDFSSNSTDRVINVEGTPTLPLTYVSRQAFAHSHGGKKKKKRLSTCDQFSIMIRSKAQLRVIFFFLSLSPELQAACLSKEQLTHLPQWQRTFPFLVQHKHEPRWVCDLKGKYKQLILPPPPSQIITRRGKVTQPGERRKAWSAGLCGEVVGGCGG